MPDARRGLLFGVAAYAMWGLFPLYWPLLEPAGAFEILAHRVLWSCLTMVVLLLLLRRGPQLRAIWRDRRVRLLLTVAAVVISVNWATYIWGVNNGRVVETSLGYFINPLVTVLMGVLILHERLRPLQWSAMGIATTAVVVLTLDYGRLPYVALVLAFTFGSYGLCKKTANVGATDSLTYETAVIAPFALAYVGWLGATGGVELRRPRTRALAALPDDRHRHRDPADLLRRRRDPGLDGVARAAAVPRAGPAVRPRRAVVPRGHARRALGRFRAGLDRAGDLHRRGGQPPAAPAAAHRRGDRGGLRTPRRPDNGSGASDPGWPEVE